MDNFFNSESDYVCPVIAQFVMSLNDFLPNAGDAIVYYTVNDTIRAAVSTAFRVAVAYTTSVASAAAYTASVAVKIVDETVLYAKVVELIEKMVEI